MLIKERGWLLSVCDRIIESGLIFLIIFTAFAFGAVHIWAYTLMELTVFFLLLIWLLKLVITSKKEKESSNWLLATDHWQLVRTPLNLPLILFLSLILFQMIPFPPGVLKTISPNTYKLYQQTLPGYGSRVQSPESGVESQESRVQSPESKSRLPTPDSRLQTDVWNPLSIYRHATQTGFLKFFTYLVVFFLITNTLKTRRQIMRLVLAIIITGAAVGFLGIVQMLSGTDKIYWFWRSHYKIGGYFGPYVNPNHFAGYMEMVIPLAIGLLLSRELPATRPQPKSWKQRLSKFDSWLSANVLLIFVIVIMASSLFLSLSRGGIISFFLSLVLLFIFRGLKKAQQWKKKVITITLGLIFAFLVWIGIAPVLQELSTLFDLETALPVRPEVWNDTITMAKNFPLFGIGLGNFQHLYPMYKTIPAQSLWDHAHNDYLEMLSDTGCLGVLFFFGGMVFFLITIIRKWQQRRHPWVVGITLGGVTGVVALLFHSLVEFNLHIPANALLLFIILGITGSTVHLNLRGKQEVSLIPLRTFTVKPRMKKAGYALIAALTLGLAVLAIKGCRGENHFQQYQSLASAMNPTNSINSMNPMNSLNLKKAISLTPSNASYHYELGRHYARMMCEQWREGTWKLKKGKWVFYPNENVIEYGQKSLSAYLQAVTLLPANAWYHANLGWILNQLTQLPINPINPTNPTNSTTPDHEFELALILDPTNHYISTAVLEWQQRLHPAHPSLRR
ncbi:MAG: O-antigen ligase family protein [Pseudomonadota bacterium]